MTYGAYGYAPGGALGIGAVVRHAGRMWQVIGATLEGDLHFDLYRAGRRKANVPRRLIRPLTDHSAFHSFKDGIDMSNVISW